MVRIKSFEAIRPRPDLAEKIASRPYDVLNSQEARIEAEGNPYSFLHVVKSEIDLPEDTDIHAPQVYEKAAENLKKMVHEGSLLREKQPALYIYRQTMGEHQQYGLVAVAHIDDYLEGKIRIHELTREVKERDRISHVDVTNANTGPVFLTYPAEANIDRMIASETEKMPIYDFIAPDGIGHTVWHIGNVDTIFGLMQAFSRIPYTYVADGHHRSKSAAMVGEMRRKANPNHTGEEEYNWFLTVLFPHNQLKILDYNRVVKDLNGLSINDFLKKLEAKFQVEKVCCRDSAKPQKPGQFGMYLDKQWYRLEANENILHTEDPVRSLDVSILQEELLTPFLNIGDPRKDERIDFIGGIRGLAELEKRVDSGEMAVAFALYPTSIEQLMAIADAGAIMPPKSTWFEPKLRSGLLVHDLD
jgi:uncharacterized protein (DUF1015 family)